MCVPRNGIKLPQKPKVIDHKNHTFLVGFRCFGATTVQVIHFRLAVAVVFFSNSAAHSLHFIVITVVLIDFTTLPNNFTTSQLPPFKLVYFWLREKIEFIHRFHHSETGNYFIRSCVFFSFLLFVCSLSLSQCFLYFFHIIDIDMSRKYNR